MMTTNKEIKEQLDKIEGTNHKPIIETIVNTVALATTGTGVVMLNNKDYFGFLLIVFGAALEYFKYWGRKKKLW
jgi:hypothetical protein